MSTTEPALEPVAEPGRGPDEPPPGWTRPELAWPLALLSGFAGAWLGMVVGFPGASEVAATAAFTPLFLGQLVRGRATLAALLGLGWALGFAGAVLGAVLEGRGEMVAAAFPLGPRFAAAAIDPWLGDGAGRPPGFGSGSGGRLALISLAWIALVPLAAWATRGVLGILLAALALGAVAGGAAGWSLRAVQAGAEPLLACFCAPPGACLAIAGLVLVSAGAAMGLLPALAEVSSGERRRRRNLILAGLGLAVLGALTEPLAAPSWASAVRRYVPM